MTISTRDGRHTAQVRYKKVSVAQTFQSLTAARKWEGRVKAAIDEGRWPDFDLIPPHLHEKFGLVKAVEAPSEIDPKIPSPAWTLGHALSVYDNEVSSAKKGWKEEHDRIEQWRQRELAAKRLDEVTPADIEAHVEARLAAGRANNTIRNECFLMSALYTHAASNDRATAGSAKGWGLALTNPINPKALPPPPAARNRRLQDADEERDTKAEEERLLAALEAGPDGKIMKAIFTLAIETGMRLGELRDIKRGQIKRSQGTRTIERPDSKNGHARRVVLSSRASSALDDALALTPDLAEEPIFYLNEGAVEYRWKKARKAAGITGLRFHDLRHEGLSRMAGMGLTLGELQAQSGHRTAQVLLGYLNAKPSEVARKLG